LNDLQEELGDQITVLAVAVHSPPEEIQKARTESGLNYTIHTTDSAVGSQWKVTQFPTTYVLDKNHHIVARDTGYTPGWELKRLARMGISGN
jgi:hypothetical protein